MFPGSIGWPSLWSLYSAQWLPMPSMLTWAFRIQYQPQDFLCYLPLFFTVWYMSEKTLSIARIHTFRRELFYWATVMATFALGTAAGDMTASTLDLGYFGSGLLFAGLFALPAIAYWRSGLNEVGAFWLAYILTRPLGASFADWLGRSRDLRGVGFGTGRISLVLIVLIVGFCFFISHTLAKAVEFRVQ